MKKKLLIGAGIVLAVFILFLIIICGGSGTDKVVTQEELEVTISTVTCDVKDEDSIEYDLALLTNDMTFESNLEEKNYTKITINQEKDFASLGVAFMVKSNSDVTLNVALNKNGVELKTTSVTIEAGNTGSVNLILDEAVAIAKTDDFTITFNQANDNSFVFDTMILFFDEV